MHKQYAITFRTPPYKDLEITMATSCWVQLRCPSKDSVSVARAFEYTPLSSGGLFKKRKFDETQGVCLEEALLEGNYSGIGTVVFNNPVAMETDGIYDLDLEFIKRVGLGENEGVWPVEKSVETIEPPPRPPKSPNLPLKCLPPPQLPPKPSPVTTPPKNKNFFKNLFSPRKLKSEKINKKSMETPEQLLDDLDEIIAIETAEQGALYVDNVPRASFGEFEEIENNN